MARRLVGDAIAYDVVALVHSLKIKIFSLVPSSISFPLLRSSTSVPSCVCTPRGHPDLDCYIYRPSVHTNNKFPILQSIGYKDVRDNCVQFDVHRGHAFCWPRERRQCLRLSQCMYKPRT